MDRRRCQLWWDAHGPPDAPPLARSACIGCPYHSSNEWLELKAEGLLEDAAEVESALAARDGAQGDYLHRRRLPLLEAVAADERDGASQCDLFMEECEGICGV